TFEQALVRVGSQAPTVAARMRLAVVGNGPLGAEVREQVAASPAREAIWLAGDRQDVPGLMRSFDVYALPSLAEGINNTLLEAMASGLPAVATRVGGNGELIENGRCGVLVDSESASAMADALSTYVLDPALRARHGAQARQRAVGRFGLDLMVAAYRELYTSLLSRRGLASPDVAPQLPGN
ncbi:MAG: glycosyltransferase, partial [Gammaproteobacteria bacterium]